MQTDNDLLHSFPDIDEVKKEAEKRQRQLLDQHSGVERLEELTFDEKR